MEDLIADVSVPRDQIAEAAPLPAIGAEIRRIEPGVERLPERWPFGIDD
jgi:hypothetical protein